MNKPKMVPITDPAEKAALIAAWHDDTVSCPSWIQGANGAMMADADELRAWRSQAKTAEKPDAL
jgi:hypothetical protein